MKIKCQNISYKLYFKIAKTFCKSVAKCKMLWYAYSGIENFATKRHIWFSMLDVSQSKIIWNETPMFSGCLCFSLNDKAIW